MSFTSFLRRLWPATQPDNIRFAPRLESLDTRVVPATFQVTNLADAGMGSLRQAVLDANANPGADIINFASGVRGTVALTSGELSITDDLIIDGPSASRLAVSGSNASRVFDVRADADVTIDGLKIRNGLANGSSPTISSTGGGILNFGNLTLTNVVVANNRAVGDPSTSPTGRVGGALGGGVANLGSGSLTVSNSSFSNNRAQGADGSTGNGAGIALGGALYTSSVATFTGSQCVFNVAEAGSSCSGNLSATASGGAIQNAGSLSIANSAFHLNQAIGGNDSTAPVRPGVGIGGAILSGGSQGPAAQLVIAGSTFTHNLAIGGSRNQVVPASTDALSGPNEAFGGAIHLSAGFATITDTTMEYNGAIGGAGGLGQDGGLAWGGGIDFFNAFGNGLTATISDSSISHNFVIGGVGGTGGVGGEAWGGGVANLIGSVLTLDNTTVDYNLAFGGAGGAGGNGGDGEGGGIWQDRHSSLTLLDTKVKHNIAVGGFAGSGGIAGDGVGGGLFLRTGGIALADQLSIISDNFASTSDVDIFGVLSLI